MKWHQGSHSAQGIPLSNLTQYNFRLQANVSEEERQEGKRASRQPEPPPATQSQPSAPAGAPSAWRTDHPDAQPASERSANVAPL